MARDGLSSIMGKGTTKRLVVASPVANDGCGDETLKPAGSLYVLRMLTTMLTTLLCLAVGVAHAQDSAFTGRVMDPSDAAVPKAHITVKNLATGVATATDTTETGGYSVPYLKPGTYSISAQAQGFRTEVRSSIQLQVGQTATIDFHMSVGAQTETVTVRGEAALLDLGKADQGEVIENARVTELPLNGRDPEMMAALIAGAVSPGYIGWERPFDDTMSGLIVNGGQGGDNEETLDGASNETSNGWYSHGVSYVPPIESVQEVKIITNPYDAKYGRGSGGVIDISLKSGTNKLHGSVYEFARRSWTDANSWQNNYQGLPNGTDHRDQYGFELDGPVRIPKVYDGRGKSFFTTQFENWTERLPTTLVTTVPDPSWLAGCSTTGCDFSNLTYWNGVANVPITIYDPLTIDKNPNDANFGNRQPFPGNVIPANRVNPVALKLLSYYPKPNTTPPPGTNSYGNNYAVPTPQTEIYRNGLVKWDQVIGSSDRLSLRYGYWERAETVDSNGLTGPFASGEFPQGERSHSFGLEWVHSFSPTLILDLHSNVMIRNDYIVNSPLASPAALGWPASLVSQLGTNATFFPAVYFNEFDSLGSGTGATKDVGNTLALLPDVTWVKGNHTMHGGLDARFLQSAVNSPGGYSFGISRGWTQQNYQTGDPASGNEIASLLLGTFDSGSVTTQPNSFWYTNYFAPYFQDDWKVSRRLTLNLGIRWDLNGPPWERHNLGNYIFKTNVVNPISSQVDPTQLPTGISPNFLGGITFLGVNGNPREVYKLSRTNIQPRIGFALALDSKSDTVLRGGIGEMFSNPVWQYQSQGFTANTNYVSSLDGGLTPTMNMSNPYQVVAQPLGASGGLETYLGQGLSFVDPNFKIPSFWTYSLGVERSFGANNIVNISYSGSRTYNLPYNNPINPISAGAYAACNIEMGGNASVCSNTVSSPFQNIAAFQGSSYYGPGATIQSFNFTRPFPEFRGVNEYVNGGRQWYNSLEVTATRRLTNSLTLHGTWTWSKNMDAGSGFTDNVYQIPVRTLDGQDRTHRITISGVYQLPVGRQHTFLGSANRFVDAVVGGWELGTLYIFDTGVPWTLPSNPQTFQYLHNAAEPLHVDKSNGFLRNVAPCVAQYNSSGAVQLEDFSVNDGCTQPDFLVSPPYAATQNVIDTGIRYPPAQQFDANLEKNFALTEQFKLQLRLEVFNVLNHPTWAGGLPSWAPSELGGAGQGPSTNISPQFGEIQRGVIDQTNLPRQLQLAMKLTW